MRSDINPRILSNLESFRQWSGLGVTFSGILVLVGWALDIDLLKRVWPGLVTMKVNTALCFILTGLALRLVNEEGVAQEATFTNSRFLARSCAVLACVIASLSLIQYALGQDFGIDELLIKDVPVEPGTLHPGRMAPITALNFLLVGGALLLWTAETCRGHHPSQFLALLVLLFSFPALLGYAYGVTSLYKINPYSSIAVHTAGLFLLLGAGILAIRPERGMMALVTRDHVGGYLVRRLLPVAVILPVIVGWLQLKGQRIGWYDTTFGIALLVTAYLTAFVGIIWTVARSTDHTEAKRRETEAALRESEVRFRNLADSAPVLIWMSGTDRGCVYFNKSWLDFTGRTLQQELGNGWAKGVHPADLDRCLDHYVTSFDAHAPFSMEYRLRHVSGAYRWILDSGIPRIAEDGAFLGYIGACIDITEQKASAQSLEIQRTFLRQVIDTDPNFIFAKDRQGRFVLANRAVADAYGTTVENLIGRTDAEFNSNRDEVDFFRKMDLEVMDTLQERFIPEEPITDANGRQRWVQTVKRPLVGEDGTAQFVLGSATDITDHKRAEERFRLVVESAPYGMIIIDEEGCIRLVNTTLERQFGYGRDELLGRPITILLPAGSSEEHIGQQNDSFTSSENRAQVDGRDLFGLKKSGNEFPVELSFTPLNTPEGRRTLVSVLDITERKQAESALIESEERLKLAQQVTQVGTFDWNMKTGVNVWTRELEAMYGLAPGSFVKTQPAWENLVHPDDRPEALRKIDLAIKTGELGHAEFRVIWPDGSVHWLAGRWRVFKTQEGKPVRLMGVNIDITAQKRAEQATRESEERFRLVVESAPYGMIIVAETGDIRLVNAALERQFGYNRYELLGRPIELLVPERFRSQHPHHRNHFFAEPSARTIGPGRDLYGLHKDGSEFPVELSLTPLDTPEGQQVLVSIVNITERKHAEEVIRRLPQQLMRAQEMERRTIARELHDQLGQLLTTIKLHVAMVQAHVHDRSLLGRLTETVELLDDALQRTRELSLELRPSVLDDIGLVPAIRWYLDRNARLAGLISHFSVEGLDNHRLAPDVESASFRVIQEAVTNVIRHAKASTVHVVIRNVQGHAEIVVADDGKGFDPDINDGTSHATTSLGILGMRERVELLNGHFEVNSAPGAGTTIVARFPLST